MFKNWLKKTDPTGKASAKGLVLEAGIPPEERVDLLPLSEEEFSRHYAAMPGLPEDAGVRAILLETLRNPDFLLTLPRGCAQKLTGPGGRLAATGLDQNALMDFLRLMHGEITRRMYIDAAAQRPGAKGIRLLMPEGVTPDPAESALTEADRHGLGSGGYPFGAIPDNPHPGRPVGYYVRVIL